MSLGVVPRLSLTLHVVAAERVKLKLEVCRVSPIKIAKNPFPFLGSIELVGVVDCVSGLVAEEDHQVSLVVGGVAHFALDTRQFVVCEMERYTNDGYLIGATPFV